MLKSIFKSLLWGVAFLLLVLFGYVAGIVVAGYAADSYVARHIHEAPHDGQWGLLVFVSMAIGGIAGAAAAFLVAFWYGMRKWAPHVSMPKEVRKLLSGEGTGVGGGLAGGEKIQTLFGADESNP